MILICTGPANDYHLHLGVDAGDHGTAPAAAWSSPGRHTGHYPVAALTNPDKTADNLRQDGQSGFLYPAPVDRNQAETIWS